MSMYSLTKLTGARKNEGRTTVWQGFEFQRKTLLVGLASLAVGFIPALALSSVMGPLGIILIPLAIAGLSSWLFLTRSRKGMKLSRYRSMLDKRTAEVGEFYICFEPISSQPDRIVVEQQSEPDDGIPSEHLIESADGGRRRRRAETPGTTVLG